MAAPLGALAPEALRRYRLVLILAATAGEGELPGGAARFVAKLKPDALSGVRFALLGLGDRAYANFCGGAEKLRATILAMGTSEAAPMARADGEPTQAWTNWLDALRTTTSLRFRAAAPLTSAATALRLVGRDRLDDPSRGDTQETWAIALESTVDLSFRPGDLLRLTPPGGGRERLYSIGGSSLVNARRIALTVRLHKWVEANGAVRLGSVSGELIRRAPIGSVVAGRIDPNPEFNPPANPATPIIMISAGSGIAPFPGFIGEREASAHAGPAWLLFGARHRQGDFLWRERWTSALRNGSLTRLDTAFSRDPDDGAYVQNRLEDNASEVRRWLKDEKAVVYICGGRAMARDVRETLARILADNALDNSPADKTRQFDEQRIHIDAFD
jgi:sulfite reductase (NADPH) flavoprotein alpha-component